MQPRTRPNVQDQGHTLPFNTRGTTVPRRVREQLFSVLPPGTDYVHLLSYEGGAHLGYRCTALSRTTGDRWSYVVATRRLLLGRVDRIQWVSQGTARALVSQQERTGSHPRSSDPLGGLITSSLLSV